VGNHTWSHADLTHLPTTQVGAQLRSTQRLLGPGGGACMRPPYGATNAAVAGVVAQSGLKQVMWTVDPQDWAHQDANYIAGHVLSHVRDRSIVLMHDGGGSRTATISAVKAMIPLLKLQGYEFRTVPACRVPLGGTITGAAEPAKRARPNPPSPSPPAPVVEPVTP
jgi:peptidoglycan/xylan/chitin deacetylase (PgdA/CDA1 family)